MHVLISQTVVLWRGMCRVKLAVLPYFQSLCLAELIIASWLYRHPVEIPHKGTCVIAVLTMHILENTTNHPCLVDCSVFLPGLADTQLCLLYKITKNSKTPTAGLKTSFHSATRGQQVYMVPFFFPQHTDTLFFLLQWNS